MENVNYSPKLLPKVVGQHLLSSAPFMLFDIGCAQGIDAVWRFFGDDLHAHGFDPLLGECARLARNETNRNIQYHSAFVALPAGHPFHAKRAARQVAYERSCESYFVRSSTYQANLRTTRDPAKASPPNPDPTEQGREPSPSKITIAEFAVRNQIKDIDFVKIDTDGGDLEAAISCQELIRPANILGFMVECFFPGAHETDNSFYNIDHFMRQNGFTLFSLTAYKYSRAALPAPFLYRSPYQTTLGQPLWGDMIYLRDAVSRDYCKVWGTELSVPKLLKLTCLYELFKLPDCAAELVITHENKLREAIDPKILLDLLTPPIQGAALSYSEYLRLFDENVEAFFPPE